MDVPETVENAEAITPEALQEAAARIFGPSEEPETPSPEDKRDEKGRFVAAKDAEKAAEPEKPTEEPKKPEDDKAAARWNAAKRAELRAAQERAELQKTRDQIAAQKAELEGLVKLAEQVKAAKLSPSKLMELMEVQPKDFLETLAREHEPEQVAQRVAMELRQELEATRKQVADLVAERDRAAAMAKRQQVDAEVSGAQKAFLDFVSASSDKYPHLVDEYTPDEIASQALALAERHSQDYFARFGVYPDDEVIAEELERQATARAESRSAWRQRIGKAPNEPSKGGSDGETAQRPAVKAEGPRTLTSRAASVKATPPKVWSQEEADAESLRILESAFRTG